MKNQHRLTQTFSTVLLWLPLAGLLAILPFHSAMAVPANPEPREITQPDGTKIQVRLRGDEFFHWTETTNGYAVVKDADNFWKYAQPATSQAEFRAIKSARVGTSDPTRLGLHKHDLPDAKVLRKHVQERRKALNVEPTEAAAQTNAQALAQTTSPTLASATGTVRPHIAVSGTKTIRNIVILACFSNHWDDVNNTVLPAYGRVDTNEYANLYNQIGYNADGAVGSVKDYYREVSYGKLTIESTITMWVRLPRESSYYGAGVHGGIPSTMVADAIEAAAAAGFDFSQGDSDGDGWVDVLDVLHSGYGEESTGNPDDVWSVKGGLSSIVTKNGVKMFNYHEEPALRGSSGTGIERIGTICHETGHFFGLPDLYDYSPLTDGLGNWCLMSGASWNGSSGTSPGHFSAWCKLFLGFANAVPVHSKIGLSLPRIEDNAVVGMLRDGTTNQEYFLIENRAKVGFDNSTQINPGLLIYHVDQKNANNDLGTWPHPAVKIEEADGNDSLGVGGGGTQAGDAWTSTSGLTGGWRDQTGNTNTSAMFYQTGALYTRTDNAAAYTYNALNNFSAAGSSMTFNAQSLKTDAPAQNALPAPFTVSWAPSSQAAKYEIQEGSPATITSFTDGAESEDGMYDNWNVHGKTLCVVTNASHGGSACYALLQGNYGAIESLVLRKPFKITTSTVISFYVASRIVAGNGFLKCELSNDGGSTWKNLSTDNGNIAPWAARSFNAAAINAAGIGTGDTCLLRFLVDIEYASSYAGFPGPGFALDDISITGTEIAGYGNWTTLDNNVNTTSYSISSKAAGVYAYRVQPYANGAWQGYGAVGETTVRANQAPVWTVNPIAGTEANAGAAYNADISSLATDEVNDTVTFSKISGPAWLTVNADGTIAGTSQPGDVGLNTFTVRATDLAGAYADAILNINVNSPIADWRMNELAGPTIYDSIGGFNGMAAGTLVYGQSGVPGAAAGNSAIAFSGSSTAVSIPALNIANNTVTITAMIKRNGTQGNYAGIVSWSSGSTVLSFGFGASDNRLTYMRGTGSYFIYNSSAMVVPDGQWTFVALVLTPTGGNLYVSTGTEVSSYSFSRADASDIFTGSAYFGNSPWSRFNGTMDEVTVYGTALSDSQITQLAATAFTPVPQVIVSSPADGAGFIKPATFDLNAAITANGHSIAKAQFYNASTLIGEDATAPYSVNVANLSNGTYTFTAKAVYDGGNVISSVPVTVHVTNAPPVCVADSASASQNTPVTIPVLTNDTDPYGLTLALQSITQPARGIAVISGNSVVYTPSNYVYGVDTFTYTAFDGVDSAASGTVTVTTPFPNFASTYTNAVLSAGPVAYWRLNETSGTTVYDLTANHKDGTKSANVALGVGGVGAPTFPGFESGNTGYQFNGTDTSVSIPALNLNSSSASVTVTAWLKRNGSQNSDAGILMWRGSATAGFRFGAANDLRISWNGYVYTSTLTVPDNIWTFVALVVEPTRMIVHMATSSSLTSWTNNTAMSVATFDGTAYIGYDSGGSTRRFNGVIDEVAIFNQSLTRAQISDLLTAAQTGLPAITLTAPAGGSHLTPLADIGLAASVTTNGNHTIEKVQFYNSALLVGEDVASPYQYNWTGVNHGSYTLTAKLLYDGGSELTSPAVNIILTNRPPVAGAMDLGATANHSATLSATKLVAVGTDPDGDALAVTEVNSPSAHGTIALASGTITYTPNTGYIGADSFTYTLSDGQGGSATGTVNVTVEAGTAISANVVSAPTIVDGNFVVRFAGTPGATYTIEYAESLASPVSWVKKTNLMAPTDNSAGFGIGVFQFSESSGGSGSRYYRTVYPAY